MCRGTGKILPLRIVADIRFLSPSWDEPVSAARIAMGPALLDGIGGADDLVMPGFAGHPFGLLRFGRGERLRHALSKHVQLLVARDGVVFGEFVPLDAQAGVLQELTLGTGQGEEDEWIVAAVLAGKRCS